MGRVRRKWALEEHALLRDAVSKAQEAGRPLNWHEIAAAVPGRTNKDCRKRWYGETATKVKKGPWTALEDARLYGAVKQHGTKWSLVASEMGTRTGDQCSKRWNHTVNPEIDHSAWTPNEDELLLEGVNKYGRNWQQIISIYFPCRTSLGAKNRYHLLCRKLEGARTCLNSKCQSPRVSSNAPTTVNEPDEPIDIGQSDGSDSESEIDVETFEDYQTTSYLSRQIEAAKGHTSRFDPRAGSGSHNCSALLESNFSDSLSGQSSDLILGGGLYSNEGDHVDLRVQNSPFSDLDLSDYTSGTTSTKRTQQHSQQAGVIAPSTPSMFSQKACNGSITQNQDDLMMDFFPDIKTVFSFDDQAMFDTDILFEPEPGMFAFGQSSTDPNITEQPPWPSSPNAPSTSVATLTPLSSAKRSLSGTALSGLAQEKRSSTTRRITIQAVCSTDEIGTIVQAVTELALSAVFKTDD